MIGPIATGLWRFLSLFSFLLGGGILTYALIFFGSHARTTEEVRYAINLKDHAMVSANLANADLVQSTTAMLVGIALIFIAFGLVLQGLVTGHEDRFGGQEISGEARAGLTMARTMPGAILALCGALVLGLAAMSHIKLDIAEPSREEVPASEPADA